MSEPYKNNQNYPPNHSLYIYSQHQQTQQNYQNYPAQHLTHQNSPNKIPSHSHQQQHQQQKCLTPNSSQIVQNFQNQQQPIQVNKQINTKIESNSIKVYLALLGLAESFKQTNQFRLCINCLESILHLKPTDIPVQVNFQIQIKTRLNLCRLYLKLTTNTNQIVNTHLEKAMIMIQNLNANDEYKYEATYVLYKIFLKQKSINNLRQNDSIDQNQSTNSIFHLDLLKNMIESSKALPVWHLRLLFLIGDILFKERDYQSAAFFMNQGILFCSQNRISSFTHILFILTKGLIHLVQQNATDLQTTMEPCAQMIENFQTNNIYQSEILKIFFLVIQVAYFTQCGQGKSVKTTLKSLQHYIQSLALKLNDESQEQQLILSQDPCENFFWLHKDHLGILTFLLIIVNYIQTGSLTKADKLIDKCLNNIHILKTRENLLSKNSILSCVYNNSAFVTRKFHYLILENQMRNHLTIGTRTKALKSLNEAFQLCHKDKRLFDIYKSQLHCLLGLYSLSVNLKESAIQHFNLGLKSTNNKDLWFYSAMNLALCYLDSTDTNNKNQLISILDNVLNDRFQTFNTAFNAFSSYFKALKFYLNSQYQPAQESLKEAIVLANSEDLVNITANAYLFMGHICLITNQLQESYNMLVSGLDIAEKMPDLKLKIYATSLLRYLYKFYNDQREQDINSKYLEADMQNSTEIHQCTNSPEHMITNWNDNLIPSTIIENIKKNMEVIDIAKIMNQNSPRPSLPKSNNNSPVIQQQSNFQNQSPKVHHHGSPSMNSPQQYRIMQQIHQQPHLNISPQYHNNHQYHHSPVQHQNLYHSPQQLSPRVHNQQMHPQQQYISPQIQQQIYYQQQQQHQIHLQQQYQQNSNNQYQQSNCK